MPWFELDGIGRDTGRKRTRKYKAANAEEAITKASADGTVVDPATIRQIGPDDPPPEPKDEPADVTRRASRYATPGPQRMTPEDRAKLDFFVRSARLGQTVLMSYQRPDDEEPTWRDVEPYDIVGTRGEEPTAVRCWQIRPEITDEPAWRCFRLDRIKQVFEGGPFSPRRRQTLLTGKMTRFGEHDDWGSRSGRRKRRTDREHEPHQSFEGLGSQFFAAASKASKAKPRPGLFRRVFGFLRGLARD